MTGSARVMFFLVTMHDRSYARHVAADESVVDAELDDAHGRPATLRARAEGAHD